MGGGGGSDDEEADELDEDNDDESQNLEYIHTDAPLKYESDFESSCSQRIGNVWGTLSSVSSV